MMHFPVVCSMLLNVLMRCTCEGARLDTATGQLHS